MNFFKHKNKKNQRGYLLIEMMVSLTIFSIIAVVSAGAVLAIVDANAKAQSTKSVMDNLNVAVENMSRTLRIGSAYYCTNTNGAVDTASGYNDTTHCNSGMNGISFLPQDSIGASDRVEYYFNPSANCVNLFCKGAIFRYRPNGTNPDTYPGTQLTAPEVDITNAQFFIYYGPSAALSQPRVFIVINGVAGAVAVQQTKFNVQTTVSERTLQ